MQPGGWRKLESEGSPGDMGYRCASFDCFRESDDAVDRPDACLRLLGKPVPLEHFALGLLHVDSRSGEVVVDSSFVPAEDPMLFL